MKIQAEVIRMKNPNMGRSSIFAVVGAYLIYLAYGMLKDMIDKVPTTMPQRLFGFLLTKSTLPNSGLPASVMP